LAAPPRGRNAGVDRDELDPRDRDGPEDEGIPDLDARLPEKEDTGDAQEGLMLPRRDHARGANAHGTTASEQREGEPLGERLEEEQPDGESGDREGAGRLIEGGRGLTDHEKDEVAERAEDDTQGMTAEEAAVRVEDAAPGGTADENDRYVEEP
jgi:hypothetical protein